MKWPKLTSRRMVIAYFACFALAWAILAVSLASAPVPELTPGTLRSGRDAVNPVALLLVLALHAVLVVGLAWQAQRWFFARGALAVVVSGLPLFVLLGQLWFVPADRKSVV